MLDLVLLKQNFSHIDFREKRPGLFKVIVPFFHEDGDMYDIFIQECPDRSNVIKISDYGITLMKLSYAFDIDTTHKEDVLESIISQNRCKLDDGEISLLVTPAQFEGGIYQFAQVISKVSSMDIISKEIAKSYFYDFLNEFVYSDLSKFGVRANVSPVDDKELKVDYEIPSKRPIYLFGVKDDAKASRVVISCLNFNMLGLPYRSLIVYEDIDKLSKFNKNQLTNTADKQFTSLKQFQEKAIEYIERELKYA